MARLIRQPMGARMRSLLLVASSSGFVAVYPAPAQVLTTAQVQVQAGEIGQGVLRSRGTECFVITPAHVLGATVGSIGIVGEASVRAQSRVERRFGSDVAVLRVEDPATLGCPAWVVSPNLDEQLARHDTGVLVTREADGSLSRMPVTVRATDSDSIYVRPSDPADRITQTMSGAALYLGTEMAGILLALEGSDGRVLQVDDVVRLTTSFFSPSSAAGKVTREVLESLVGDYNAGSIVIKIALRADGTLTSQAGTTPAGALLHEKDLRFRAEADPRVVFEFRRDAAGEVFAFFSHQPNGVVPAIRQSDERVTREQLQAFAGTYHAGEAKFIVELDAKGVLTFAVQGRPAVELLFARDRHFVVRGSGGAYIEFVRDPNGVVTGLIVQGATPIFASRFR